MAPARRDTSRTATPRRSDEAWLGLLGSAAELFRPIDEPDHDARLMLMGFHVVRVGYSQVVHRWPEVQDLLTRAVAQGLHLAR